MQGCHRALLGLALLVQTATVTTASVTASAAAASHEYKKGDLIVLYANKVGPFTNPTETYQFYNLPFCQPSGGKEYKIEDLGEVGSCSYCFGCPVQQSLQQHATLLLQVLEGDRLVNTPYQIKFRVDVDDAELCKKKLNSKELQQLRDAVKNDYYFQASHGACLAKGGSMEAVAAFGCLQCSLPLLTLPAAYASKGAM
jgi:hypothetical protein